MLQFAFTWRHLKRHWRMNVAVLVGLTLAAALLASLPSYATAIAARGLNQNLETASASIRNLLVAGPTQVLSAGLYGRLQDGLGSLIKSRVEIRQVELQADPVRPTSQVDGSGRVIRYFRLWSFDKLSSSVKVVEGKLPAPAAPEQATSPLKPPPVEAVLGVAAAQRTGLGIGDRLTAQDEFYTLNIVGIVEPLAPDDDAWGGDLGAFDIEIDSSNPNVDTITLSSIVASGSMKTIFPGHQVDWRVLIDREQITVDNAATVQSDLISLQAKLGTNRAHISSGLPQMLEDYLTQLSRVRMSLFLLTTQAFVFVLYTLGMLTLFVLDRTQGELATLAGRGATALQITRVFALESLMLALPAALLLGPLVAHGALTLWAAITDAAIPTGISQESRLLALVATGFGWLALVLPVYPAARRNLLDWERARARPPRLSTTQKLYLDLFLLMLGGLLYWQLRQSGSFVMRRLRDTPVADPLLLLGPSLMLIAVALVFLRIAPYLLRFVAWMFQRTRGLMLPLGLSRLARDPIRPSRVVLLISLTAGLTVFTLAFSESLESNQKEMARYLAGADLRVSLDPIAGEPDLTFDQVATLPGIVTMSRVFRAIVQTGEGRGIQLLALDPASFTRVTGYPPGLTGLTMSSITAVIRARGTDDTLPAIFSYAALPTRNVVGDQVSLTLGGQRLNFNVYGTISNFPTLSGPYAITNLPELERRFQRRALGAGALESYEAWLTVNPEKRATLIRRPELEGRILDDAQGQLQLLQADALAHGTNGAFQLSTVTLAVLSAAGFLLVHFFAAQQRVVEFSVLRAMGLSARQLFTLLATEGALVTVLGLAAGTIIGYGLAQIMVPYLSQALSESLGGVTIREILLDWPAVVWLYLLLAVVYGLVMLLLLLTLMRAGVHRVMRIGDE